jgi:hypothetical protein
VFDSLLCDSTWTAMCVGEDDGFIPDNNARACECHQLS